MAGTIDAMAAVGEECIRCGAHHVTPRPHRDTLCYQCAAAAWIEDEQRYAANSYAGQDPPGSIAETRGDPALWFTAASAVNTRRAAATLLAGRNTGALAAALAATTGFSALAQSGTPIARRDHVGPSPELIASLAVRVPQDAFIIDLRGMRDRNVDVCIGLGPTPTDRTEHVAGTLSASLEGRGLRVARNEPFAGAGPWSVTHHWHHAHPGRGNALQLGVGSWLRDPLDSPSATTLLLSRLTIAALQLDLAPAAVR